MEDFFPWGGHSHAPHNYVETAGANSARGREGEANDEEALHETEEEEVFHSHQEALFGHGKGGGGGGMEN